MMRFLRQTGFLPVRHATRYLATFNRADVEELLSRIHAIPAARGISTIKIPRTYALLMPETCGTAH